MPNKHASGWRNDVSSKISGKVVVRFEKPEEAAAARRKAAEAAAAEAEAAEAEAQRKAIGGLAIGKRTRERVSIADQYRAANLPLPLPIRSPISRNASQSSEYVTPPSSPIGNRGTSVPARSYASPANTRPAERRTLINKVQKWLTPPPWLPNPPGKRWRLGGMRSRTMRSRRKGTQRKGIPRKGTRRKGTQRKGTQRKGTRRKGTRRKGTRRKGIQRK